MKRVVLAETAGFCFGVNRAVDLTEQTIQRDGACVTLGPVIHNRHAVERLGARIIELPEEAEPGSRLIIRSHGVGRAVVEALEARRVEIIDATCPYVKKIHRIIETADQNGRRVMIVGQRDHPEVIAAGGWCSGPVVVETAAELEQWLQMEECPEKPLTVVFQTTYARANMEALRQILKKWCTSVEIFDTICDATSERQAEAASLAAISDAMIVIGDLTSANSRNLAAICAQYCPRVAFIESKADLDLGLFDGADTIGIVAGASTPAWIIKEVYQTMNDEILKATEETESTQLTETAELETEVTPAPMAEATTAPEDESFEALLEKSIKTLRTGEKVVGIVAAITPTEITIDLGTKHAAYIPVHELTDDPEVKVEDLIQIGGEVEAYVMRVNDVEGTVMLSKKRLDAGKFWDEIGAASDSRAVVEGVVTEENKGGVVVRVKGIRVFVPASQTGVPKDQPLDQLVGQKVKLRITEVNQSKRRVVGSIRAVGSELRKELAEKLWEGIEAGKRYLGTVKSLTPYGAFVDIGGVDGMVHVSELSWSRVKSPADAVKVGDKLEVYIISFDKEKQKISLGHKDPNLNPWKMFTDKFEKGAVTRVKVVKLMPFGAFAEVMPGVDGLIHISQISDRRIAKPQEVLSEGQEVDVQITDIDYDKKNISLSMRALFESPSGSAAASDAEQSGPDEIVYDTDIDKPEVEIEIEVPAEVEVEIEVPVEVAEEIDPVALAEEVITEAAAEEGEEA
ncbi:MAG: bifunctional 4-hydroxy-3-methylbut-2-enyl diphosphate reductase/30S ribosomal protein S1 [Oscillospiraceae bacterium]|nr:bifunctional 4-hydroxy-3-methylbut-2-enyl diphosphate reductase/30S ribosomal protein S1 [Oscillospiraceae bacterium]